MNESICHWIIGSFKEVFFLKESSIKSILNIGSLQCKLMLREKKSIKRMNEREKKKREIIFNLKLIDYIVYSNFTICIIIFEWQSFQKKKFNKDKFRG